MNRILAIGDVHGCLAELRSLLEKVVYDPSRDHLVFVGDLIDRGPDSPGVVRLVRELQRIAPVTVIRGNHDDNAVRWCQRAIRASLTGQVNQMKPPHPNRRAEWAQLSLGDIGWLSELPVVVAVAPSWLAVHGGFEDKQLGEQKDDKVMRCRYLDAQTGKMVSLKETDTLDQPPDTVWWTERWRGSDNVVYGHAVHDLADPRVDQCGDVQCWGIDTGCVFGGRLTAIDLSQARPTVWQVQAERAYADFNRYLGSKVE